MSVISKQCKNNEVEGFVCNPVTGKWVKIDGLIGKKVLSAYPKDKLQFSGKSITSEAKVEHKLRIPKPIEIETKIEHKLRIPKPIEIEAKVEHKLTIPKPIEIEANS